MSKLRTNTKKYAQEAEQLDAQDWQEVLRSIAPTPTRCIGGRLVHPDFVCAHCGSASPNTTCKETAEQVIQAKHDRRNALQDFTI